MDGPEPAGQAAGAAGHRLAARVAREARRQLVEPALQPLDHRRIGALLGPEDARSILEGNPDVADDVQVKGRRGGSRRGSRGRRGPEPGNAASNPASLNASRAPAPPSVVADPPTVTTIGDAPADAAATISSPVPRVDAAQASRSGSATSDSPLACAISTTAEPSGSSAKPASTGRPSGSDTVRALTSPPSAATRTSMVPSPPSATGSSRASRPASRSPAAMAPATSRAENVPLNESGATRTGSVKARPGRRAPLRRRAPRTRCAPGRRCALGRRRP